MLIGVKLRISFKLERDDATRAKDHLREVSEFDVRKVLLQTLWFDFVGSENF